MPAERGLEGRAAIVTGAAAGIGRAIAAELGRQGASVAVVDIDGAGARRTVAELGGRGVPALAIEADVADEDAVQEAVDAVAARFGRLDLLVNNAATFEAGMRETDLDIETTPTATWRRALAVNLDGPMFAARAAIPHMLDGPGRGVIVNISTSAARNGDVVHLAYAASKAALESLTRSIATSHGPRGIRCNTIATGLVMTELAQQTVPPAKLAAYQRTWLVDGPGRPEEVAALVAFVAGDQARYLQGQTILVDGGANAHQPWHALNDVIHPEAPSVRAGSATPTPAGGPR